MKKTERYQLNLIEKEDDFSPEPLNENMEKVETQLDSLRAETAAGDAALEQRVQVLELHKCVSGSYVGNGEGNGDFLDIKVGFTPTAVLTSKGICLEELSNPSTTNNSTYVEIIPDGFRVYMRVKNGSGLGSINFKGSTYSYIAFC